MAKKAKKSLEALPAFPSLSIDKVLTRYELKRLLWACFPNIPTYDDDIDVNDFFEQYIIKGQYLSYHHPKYDMVKGYTLRSVLGYVLCRLRQEVQS